jgi:hypothetical protein
MAGGFREIVINTQERAISPDVNRLQKFKGKDIAELLRYTYGVTANDDIDAGANITEYTSLTNPLKGEIVNGIQAEPQLASTSVFVSPGLAMLIQPDSASDDSVFKYVRDAGRNALNPLTIAANASGSIRIDVVEIQMGSPSVVTDSRDEFNPVTGLFTARAVVKEQAGALAYRVRQGTPGSGFPGTATGWLPIMVAHVPPGSTNNDACYFWDVRPLLSDRENSYSCLERTQAEWRDLRLQLLNDTLTPNPLQMVGSFDIRGQGRRAGGLIRVTGPEPDADVIIMGSSPNVVTGFTNAQVGHIYALFPFGLPRWARYTDAAALVRKPRSPRGLLVLSNEYPLANGRPQADITIPTAYGFGAADTTDGFHVISVPSVGPGAVVGPATTDGSWVIGSGDLAFRFDTNIPVTGNYGGFSPGWIEVTVSSDAVPPYAKAIDLSITIEMTVPAMLTYTFAPGPALQVNPGGQSNFQAADLQVPYLTFANTTGAPATRSATFRVRMPVSRDPTGGLLDSLCRFELGTGLTAVVVTGFVGGYKV